MKIKLPNLREASDKSTVLLLEAKKYLKEEVPPEKAPIDIVVLGSLARQEITPESDLDYFVIVHSLLSSEKISLTKKLLSSADNLREKLELNKPGRTGMFGAVLSAPDLIERIGLEQDTNLSHSRRILLLQESASIYQPNLHEQLLRGILGRYLVDYPGPKRGVPRFLLNDVMRYWRTLAVDYQAKRWEALTPNWGLRFLKLIISRKIVYAGTLVTLLLTKEATVDYFYEQFSMPALARIAQLHSELSSEYWKDLATILTIYDTFISKISDEKFREDASKIQSPHEIEEKSEFAEMRTKGRELQKALENIFFHSPRLKKRAIRYMSF